MDILIPEKIFGKAVDELNTRYIIERHVELWQQPERLAKRVGTTRALLVRNQTIVDKHIIDAAAALQIIGRAGAGYDNIDVAYASSKGVVVCYTPDSNTISAAELTIGLMLAMLRKIPSADKTTKSGMWDRFGHVGREMFNKKLGIVGFGKIGRAVAKRAQSFGVEILVFDKCLDEQSTGTACLAVSLEELLRESDIVTIHLPLNEETKHLFNRSLFTLMKPGAILINSARGEILVENDLIEALESGRITGAALDVREVEPAAASILNTFDNVILTPHIGAFTVEAQERVLCSITRDIDLVLQGKKALNFVNFATPGEKST